MQNAVKTFRARVKEVYEGRIDKYILMNDTTFQFLLKEPELMEETQPREKGPSIPILPPPSPGISHRIITKSLPKQCRLASSLSKRGGSAMSIHG